MKKHRFLQWLFTAGIAAIAWTAFGSISASAGALYDQDTGLSYIYDAEKDEVTVNGGDYTRSEFVIPAELGGHKVTAIAEEAFFWRRTLTSVSVADTVTEIGKNAFYHCDVLETISLPGAVTVGDYAFSRCPALKDISLPNAESLGEGAFYQSAALESVSAPNLRTVGVYAFEECTALKEISMPMVETIRSCAFSKCSSIKNLSLPATLKQIDNCAFWKCSSLKTLTISGPTVLMNEAFSECPELTSVWLSDESSTVRDRSGFAHCPKLMSVNGVEPVLSQTRNGCSYPVLDSAVDTAIRNHFCRAVNVGFVDDYCSKLCTYIVQTETDPWMCDALKARQLHDWIIRHCEYEDCEDDETLDDRENHVPSSVFFSYAYNVRGKAENQNDPDKWIGESVCAGYAKAYTMLLAEAGIRSYPIYSNSHMWTIVELPDPDHGGCNYYQIDVTWDDPIVIDRETGKRVEDNTFGNIYSTRYVHFLKTNDEMIPLHKNQHSGPTYANYKDEHKLLGKYVRTYDEVAKMIEPENDPVTGEPPYIRQYADGNGDGILDEDYNLNGKGILYTDFGRPDDHVYEDPDTVPDAWNYSDLDAWHYWEFMFCCTMQGMDNKLPELLYFLHGRHESFEQYIKHSQPQNVSAADGDPAEFSMTLFGKNLTYQWQSCEKEGSAWTNVNADSATSATLRITASEEKNGTRYGCIVTNAAGKTYYSELAELKVIPKISAQPKSAPVPLNGTAEYTVSASGSGLTYQWQYYNKTTGKWANTTLTGAKTATLRVPATSSRNGQKYSCVIRNSCGNSVRSASVVLKPVAKISAQPVSVTAAVGDTAKLTAAAEGSGLTYQWQYYNKVTKKWANTTLSGAKTATLSVPATEARNGIKYRCAVTNSLGNTVNTDSASLTVTAKIVTQPVSQKVTAGSTAKFRVKAMGSGLTYQWQYYNKTTKKWVNTTVTGAKTATLSVPATAARNGAKYRCVVKNSLGNTVNSAAVTLTVL